MSASFKPSREHNLLQQYVGDWDVECEYFFGSEDTPIQIQGKETVEALGEFWIIGRFEADILGQMLIGQSVRGYDPVKEKFIETWKDSATPFLYAFEGDLDKDGTRLTMKGKNYDPVRQWRAPYTGKIEFHGKDKRILTLSVETIDGDEVRILRYISTRRKK